VVKFEGSVSAVDMAVQAGKAEAERRGMFIASFIIPRQEEQIEWLAHLNALGKSSTI
jgi:microcompartment protein CcmL/EutN